jgi:hypothetical protein
LKEWTRERLGSTAFQIAIALTLTFAFAAPLALVLLGLQNPENLPSWFARLLGATDGTIPYTSLSLILLALVGLWIATSGLTGIVRAATLAREIAALAARIAAEIGESPSGEVVRRNKQRLNVERQLIDAHYSLAVVASRNVVFLGVALTVVPLPIALTVCIAQAYLLRSAVLRYRDGRGVYEWFASIHDRSHGKDGDAAIVTEFGDWLGDWERKLNALPIRDYAIGAAIVVSGIGAQLALSHEVASWSNGIPVVGVWAIVSFEMSRALAHYGFSIARWSASTTGDFY